MIYQSLGNGYYRKVSENQSFIGWYKTLRQYHHWSVWDAIRYAFWLAM